jgi:hypothetical protein
MTPSFPFRALFSVIITPDSPDFIRPTPAPDGGSSPARSTSGTAGPCGKETPAREKLRRELALAPGWADSGYMKVLEWRVVQGAGLGSILIECEFHLYCKLQSPLETDKTVATPYCGPRADGGL